jgi:hypothetical protein
MTFLLEKQIQRSSVREGGAGAIRPNAASARRLRYATPTRRLLVVISLEPEPGFAALVASRLPERVGFHGITSYYLPKLIINRRAFIVNRKNRGAAAGGRVGEIFSLTARGTYVILNRKLTDTADVRPY